MGWTIPWLIGELTPYPNGRSRLQIEAGSGGEPGSGHAAPSAEWVRQLSAEWRAVFLIGGGCTWWARSCTSHSRRTWCSRGRS